MTDEGTGIVDFFEDNFATLVIKSAGFREADATCVAIEKPRAEVAFQPADLLSSSGLRDGEVVGRFGKAAEFDHAGENADAGEMIHVVEPRV